MTIFRRTILVVGHPRTGTGYTAQLLQQCGLDIGHENDGKDGVSSWMMAVNDDNPWYSHPIAKRRDNLVYQYCIHPVRNISTGAASIIRENARAPKSYEFRRKHILEIMGIDLNECASELDCAVQSLILWTSIIEKLEPSVWFRIEEHPTPLLKFLEINSIVPNAFGIDIDTSPVNADKLYLGKRYPKPRITLEEWMRLPEFTKMAIENYC